MNNTARNMVDVTDLSDAAFDVFLAVKAGEECVSVEHLSVKEIYMVCDALGIKVPAYWLTSTSRPVGRCYEGAILARQERNFAD